MCESGIRQRSVKAPDPGCFQLLNHNTVIVLEMKVWLTLIGRWSLMLFLSDLWMSFLAPAFSCKMGVKLGCQKVPQRLGDEALTHVAKLSRNLFRSGPEPLALRNPFGCSVDYLFNMVI